MIIPIASFIAFTTCLCAHTEFDRFLFFMVIATYIDTIINTLDDY